jgi:hypothetical protein
VLKVEPTVRKVHQARIDRGLQIVRRSVAAIVDDSGGGDDLVEGRLFVQAAQQEQELRLRREI